MKGEIEVKREFLKGLELSDEAIDKIMAENGKDIEKFKKDAEAAESKNAEIETLKGQLSEANKQIEDFKGMDIDGIKKAADEWKEKAAQAEKDAADKITKMQFDHALEAALSGAKVKNVKAARALIDVDGLSLKDGEIPGLKDQIEKIKSENDYLFESDEAKPQFAGGSHQTEMNDMDAARAVMGLPTQTK